MVGLGTGSYAIDVGNHIRNRSERVISRWMESTNLNRSAKCLLYVVHNTVEGGGVPGFMGGAHIYTNSH